MLLLGLMLVMLEYKRSFERPLALGEELDSDATAGFDVSDVGIQEKLQHRCVICIQILLLLENASIRRTNTYCEKVLNST